MQIHFQTAARANLEHCSYIRTHMGQQSEESRKDNILFCQNQSNTHFSF